MKPTAIVLILLALCAYPGAETQPAASPEVLLKAAMQKELIDNDLPAAIVQYTVIVERFPKHAAAATALLQMAGIHARRKDQAAERQALDRLLRDHANSPEAAGLRQRQRSETSSRFKETQFTLSGRAEGMLGAGRVSPDGRHLSFADHMNDVGTGSLALWDTRLGQVTVPSKFTNLEPWQDGSAWESVWSPDGRQLAYAWRNAGQGRSRELRIVDRATGRHRVLLSTPEGTGWLSPLAFSNDGLSVLASLGAGAGEGTVRTAELVLVTVSNGEKRTLKSFEGTLPAGGVFSPDGGHVAYDFQPRAGSTARSIAILDVRTGSARTLAEDRPAHEVLLGWLPSGHLLYTSDRDGSTDAWAIQVKGGAPQGSAFVVKRDAGQLQPQGVTRDGRVFVWKWVPYREIYVAELDPRSGRAAGPATPLAHTQSSLRRGEPSWSPDGMSIAYVQTAAGRPQTVVVQRLRDNQQRVYDVPVRNIDWPIWSPDSKAFYFDGTGEDNVQRSFRLDIDSGQVERASDPRRVIVGFSPDGRSVFEIGAGRGFSRRHLDTGAVEVLGGGAPAIAMSPDKQWVAYLGRGPREANTLLLRRVSGGEAQVIANNVSPGYPRLAWTPDSRAVIFNHLPEGLQRVSIDGTERVSLGIKDMGWITEKSVHPDGKRIAFGVSRDRTELWVWENVVSRGKQP